MMMKQLLIVMGCLGGMIAVPAAAQQLSNNGKEFWVAYGHHQYFEAGNTNSQEMVLYLSTEQAATVKVSINGTSWTRTYNVPANSVMATDYMPKSGVNDCRLYTLPPSFGGTGSEGIFTRGIHIESDVPIVAYAHIFGAQSSGATMLMPVESWGYNYTSLNFTQYFNTDCFSWMNVIASHDNTKIQITTTTPTRGGRAANETFTAVLNKGQVYQLLGAGLSTPVGSGYDITGTTVKVIPNDAGECYRIAAFSGTSRTRMSMGNCEPRGGDNGIQQIFPSQAWGKRYLTALTSTSEGAIYLMPNYYRIMVNDPTTEVRLNGNVLSGLINNRYYEYASSSSDYITADKPIMVAQYMPSTGCNGSQLGDEEMIYISPMEQAIKRVGFYRSTKQNIEVNYLTLIIPTLGIPSLRIDGSPAFDLSYPHPNLPGYTVVIKRWKAAQAQATVVSDSAFTGITYGLGSTESYGYNAGTLITNLHGGGEIRNQYQTGTAASSYTCRKTPFIPSVLIGYKPTRLRWAFSEAGNISPATDVMEVMPVPVDSLLVGTSWFYRYTLQQLYAYSDTGSQIIPIYSTHPAIENCNNTEVINIPVEVNAGLVADFTYSNSLSAQVFTGCRLDTVYIKPATPAARYRWSFSAATADTAWSDAPSKYYTASGNYAIHMQGVQADGCVADTVKTITIHPPPTAGFTVSASAVCANASLTVTNTAAYAGNMPIQSMYWNFGDGQLSSSTAASFTLSYQQSGTHTIKQVARISALCVSDTATAVVKINALPVAAFRSADGCLAVDGVAQFTNTSTVADGQGMTYLWNFGDAASGAANTSTARHPSHAYSSYQQYTIALTATTTEGCVDDTTVKITFALRPALTFDPLAAICGNIKDAAVNKARVTNGVPGTGIYKGPGVQSNGRMDATVAGDGPRTIWYIFQTTGACSDSTSQQVQVLPRPEAKFTVAETVVCEGEAHSFTDASNGVNSNIVRWQWIWGDGATSAQANATKTYKEPGAHKPGLIVTDDRGCISDTAFAIVTVYPLPLVDAGPSFAVAEGTRVTFAPVVNDAGAKILWTPATALSNTTVLQPSLIVTGDQTYTLAVTNAGNCTATDTVNVRVVRTVMVPNIFTPNGDGINDVWAITHLEDYPAVTIQVFNRYGSRVWLQNGYAKKWDGASNGAPLPAGTYYYIIDLKNGSKALSGTVTIIR